MMKWTDADMAFLRDFRKVVDSDDVRIKERVKEVLVQDKYIIHVLNNPELVEKQAEPDEYFGINILPYYMVTPTQTDVKNFICFDTSYDELGRYNNYVKIQQLVFTILCNDQTLSDRETGLSRHDLLAELILRDFNWTNLFGKKMHCVSNKSGVVDTHYATRTLIFEQTTDNNVVQTHGGVARMINKETIG